MQVHLTTQFFKGEQLNTQLLGIIVQIPNILLVRIQFAKLHPFPRYVEGMQTLDLSSS